MCTIATYEWGFDNVPMASPVSFARAVVKVEFGFIIKDITAKTAGLLKKQELLTIVLSQEKDIAEDDGDEKEDDDEEEDEYNSCIINITKSPNQSDDHNHNHNLRLHMHSFHNVSIVNSSLPISIRDVVNGSIATQ